MFVSVYLVTAVWLIQMQAASPPAYALPPRLQNDFYEQGDSLRNAGDWKTALKSWWAGRNELELQGTSDPRMGISFIELATEQNVTQYYGSASNMYLWGFSQEILPRAQHVVIEEAKRLLPLLEKQTADAWQKRIASQDSSLAQDIRLFWLEKDPRPTTPANERLVEHWLRIAWARKHFTKNRNSVYGCDDRGIIYVKYGAPDRTKAGLFGTSGASKLELMRWVEDPLKRLKIQTENPSPEYEVWLYHNIGTQEPAVFLFSQRDGTGSFGLRAGIEWLSKNYIYQFMYYADLMSFADFFYDRYTQLEHIWQWERDRGRNAPNPRLLKGIFELNKFTDKVDPVRKYAKVANSDFEERLAPVAVYPTAIRLLNARGRPQLAVIAVSSPKLQAAAVHNTSERILAIPDYRVQHTLIVRDESLREISRQRETVSRLLENLSVFVLKHEAKAFHYTLAAEAFAASAEAESASEQPAQLLAAGKTFFRTGPPLLGHADSLEVSDLILGIELPPEKRTSQWPFPVLPARKFLSTEPLRVYLEVYNLKRARDGLAHYTIEFSAVKLDKQNKLNQREQQIALTFSFEGSETTSKEHFGIDISNLQPGEYELMARVRDSVTDREKTRRAKFTIHCED